MRPSNAILLAALWTASPFGLAEESLSSDRTTDTPSSESILLPRAGTPRVQTLTDDRGKVRSFVDELMAEEGSKSLSSQGNNEVSHVDPAAE